MKWLSLPELHYKYILQNLIIFIFKLNNQITAFYNKTLKKYIKALSTFLLRKLFILFMNEVRIATIYLIGLTMVYFTRSFCF